MRTKIQTIMVELTDNNLLILKGTWKDLKFINQNSKSLDLLITEKFVPYTITVKSRFFGAVQTYTISK